jgi:hypothetical protein
MNRSLSLANRYVRIGLVAAVLLFLGLLLLAPATGQKTSGSTYNRAPEGYLGWYQYMAAQGTPVQRWRRPLDELLENASAEPQTLLRIYPGIVNAYQAWNPDWLESWLAAGNTLIALGIDAEITEAPFTTRQDSSFGTVVIKTRRRNTDLAVNSDRTVLGDAYGAIVWQGIDADFDTLYVAPTPHLAANAYLDAPGNYALLAELATQVDGPIWVDEYLHGFKDADVVVEETINSWGAYLVRTPVKVAGMQILILLGIFLLAQNRRLGNLIPVKAPKVDNSQAYIEALAAVLHKAESTPFLVDMITKAERSHLQRALGFNEAGVDDAALTSAWTQQTGQSRQHLSPLLQPPKPASRSADPAINAWLTKLWSIRQTPIR